MSLCVLELKIKLITLLFETIPFSNQVRSYLKLAYEYELRILQTLALQRITVKPHEGQNACGPPSFAQSSTARLKLLSR